MRVDGSASELATPSPYVAQPVAKGAGVAGSDMVDRHGAAAAEERDALR